MSNHGPRLLGATTTGITWIDRLDEARSVAEVLDVVRVYLAQYSPMEVASMPSMCRPRKLMGAEDLSEYALDLVRETCVNDDRSPLVTKLAAIVSHASARLSELSAVANDDA